MEVALATMTIVEARAIIAGAVQAIDRDLAELRNRGVRHVQVTAVELLILENMGLTVDLITGSVAKEPVEPLLTIPVVGEVGAGGSVKLYRNGNGSK